MKIQDLANDTTLFLESTNYDFIYQRITVSMKILPTEGTIYIKNDEHFRNVVTIFGKIDESPQPVLATLVQLSPLELVDWLKSQYVIWVNNPDTRMGTTHPSLIVLFQYIDSIGIAV